MTRLDQFAFDRYSQFGEDGCIEHILQVIKPRSQVCVEFGAGDGDSCSNTAHLWRDQAWHGVLVEPDHGRFADLEGNTSHFSTTCVRNFVTPSGPDSISQVLDYHGIIDVDVMSIDVDGDDYMILRELTVRPRMIAIEFNPTIPPHVELRQSGLGEVFGASLLSIIRLAQSMDYRFVGATYCNAFLVAESEAAPFDSYETDPEVLFPPGNYTYAVTDFSGRITLCGKDLPWGTRAPYVLPLESSVPVLLPTDSAQQIRRGLESVWGPAIWLSPSGLSRDRLTQMLHPFPALICLDYTNIADLETVAWIADLAEDAGYRSLLVGRVLGLISPGAS